ncbi:MAG: Gfo/Idh/MocA family oxidoreductase [Planctomycetales bacterium]|nr:Gfo/Idh/MocA family oxidoreductase [Planctomycetales bacterium]MBN8627280.1 Gfo/Idh/MocA family oxidoreductase [Planctomycetota bacterium]
MKLDVSKLSRRDFVERAILSASAALAGGALSRNAFAAESDAARKVGPNDKLRVAVIGVNGQGGSHVNEWLKNPDVDLVAICDVDPAAYAKVSKKIKDQSRLPEYVQDVRKLFERKDIDAVSIATPNHWHAVMAVWAMQSGKDVYVEKPCSHNVHEGRVMTEWARKLGRMCQMGVQSRSMTGMRESLDFIHSGKIGKVEFARAICYRLRNSIGLVDTPAPVPEGLDLDLWCGPAAKAVPIRKRFHYDWHWVFETGNGDLGNQNPHELDKARWGLQKQELPKQVVSLGGRLGYVDNGDVANCQVTLYRWDDAFLISDVRGLPIKSPITLGLKAGGPFKGAANIWYGTEGYVVGPNYNSGVAFDYDGKEIGKWSGGEYQAHFANFVKAIRSRNYKDLHLDIEDGHLSSALAHLGNVSYRLGTPASDGTRPSEDWLAQKGVTETFESLESYLGENNVNYDETKFYLGRTLTIDPKTERSTDEEANKLFTREYRKGYELPEVTG